MELGASQSGYVASILMSDSAKRGYYLTTELLTMILCGPTFPVQKAKIRNSAQSSSSKDVINVWNVWAREKSRQKVPKFESDLH